MKKTKRFFALLFVMAIAQYGFAQITGSAHDFTTAGNSWNTTGEMCIVCHTPHNADGTVADAPLWNHEVTAQTYNLYSGYDMDATVGQPASSSKLCLSCHDGTVAIDNFGGTTTGTTFITGAELLGTDLSNDHPISITYDALLASADGGLFDPTTTTSGLGGTISADMLAGGNQVQCSSCHDVHNAANLSFLLVKTNLGSALCLTCHNK
jgi:predicted CXXCH cytochrome family protein